MAPQTPIKPPRKQAPPPTGKNAHKSQTKIAEIIPPVEIEEDLIYPLLKSSDIANGKIEIRKKVLITQRQIGEDTGYIKGKYPKTWQYLNDHFNDFEKRKSAIYKNKPMFSIFSIGNYSFFPYKIAISGLYKKINFKMLSPVMEKPVMVDDTCNFLSCNTEAEAYILYSLLTSRDVELFLNSLIFWDSKRPITTQILNSINLGKAADNNGLNKHYNNLTNNSVFCADNFILKGQNAASIDCMPPISLLHVPSRRRPQ